MNDKDNGGYTALQCACYRGRVEVVKYLITSPGFNSLNEKDDYHDRTPLHVAYYHGHIEIVKELLKYKNIIIPDKLEFIFALEEITNKIEKLFESYKQDPFITRIKLILDENLDIYRLIIYICDDYFKLKKKTKNKKGKRFLKIAKQLPSLMKIL